MGTERALPRLILSMMEFTVKSIFEICSLWRPEYAPRLVPPDEAVSSFACGKPLSARGGLDNQRL